MKVLIEIPDVNKINKGAVTDTDTDWSGLRRK